MKKRSDSFRSLLFLDDLRGQVGWMPRLACPVLTGEAEREADSVMISAFPVSGELH